MHHTLARELQGLGLTAKEAEVYLELHRHASPTRIARASGIKRATVYLSLESLADKGLVAREVKNKRASYTLLHNRTALTHYIRMRKEEVQRQEKILATVLPALHAIAVEAPESHVLCLSGEKGLQTLIEKIIATKKTLFWIGSGDAVVSLMEEEKIFNLLTQRRIKQQTSVYAITDRTILAYPKLSIGTETHRYMRFMKQKIASPALLGIFGPHFFLVTKERGVAKTILIDSPRMTAMVSLLLESTWNGLT